MILAVLCGILFFCLCCIGIEYSRHDRIIVRQRMRMYVAGETQRSAVEARQRQVPLLVRCRRFVRRFAGQIQRIRHSRQLELLMQRAGLPLLGAEFIVLMALLSLAGGILGMTAGHGLWGPAGGCVSGVLLCVVYLKLRIRRRQRAFSNQLGDTLVMVANAMRAGFSFVQSMDMVSREMAAPMGDEFAKVMAEIRLGATIEAALENMALRIGSNDFQLMVAAVLIQRQVGGNLAQILDTIGGTVQNRIRMKREVRTLTAQGRSAGYILAALPFAMAGILSLLQPGYLQPLLENELGRMAVAGALALEVIGFLVIQRIVDIDV
mgnify:CR=1 FL=1